MPELLENAPGRDQNSQDPKGRAATLQLLLPEDNAFSIATTYQTGNDSHGVARGKCSRARKLDQIRTGISSSKDLFLTLDVMTIEIVMTDQSNGLKRVDHAQSSSRLTIPSFKARLIPFPTSFSFP